MQGVPVRPGPASLKRVWRGRLEEPLSPEFRSGTGAGRPVRSGAGLIGSVKVEAFTPKVAGGFWSSVLDQLGSCNVHELPNRDPAGSAALDDAERIPDRRVVEPGMTE